MSRPSKLPTAGEETDAEPAAELAHGPEPTNDGASLDVRALTGFIGYALRRAQVTVFEDVIEALAPLQLSPAQFSVLLLINENPGRKQADIASALGIQGPNFVSLLDGLEDRGLCMRTRSKSDRRSYALVLTARGRKTLTHARSIVAEHEARVITALGANNHQPLLEMLWSISRNLKAPAEKS